MFPSVMIIADVIVLRYKSKVDIYIILFRTKKSNIIYCDNLSFYIFIIHNWTYDANTENINNNKIL